MYRVERYIITDLGRYDFEPEVRPYKDVRNLHGKCIWEHFTEEFNQETKVIELYKHTDEGFICYVITPLAVA